MNTNKTNIIQHDLLVYTPKKGALEAISLFASQICNTPISFISIINKNKEWFKASVGIQEVNEKFIKDFNYINTSSTKPKLTEVDNVIHHSELFNHPLILKKNIVYYASVPLISPSGQILGSIGVMDRKKRKLTPKQKKAFLELSIQVIESTSERLSRTEYEKNILVFKKKNDAIAEFTNIAVENMTSPINTITLLSDIINKNCSEELSLKLNNYLHLIDSASKKMVSLINEVKDFYDNIDLISLPKEEFLLEDLLKSITKPEEELGFSYDPIEGKKRIFANKLALKKIIESQIDTCMNITKMSLEKHHVSIFFTEKKDSYWFSFKADRAINKETLKHFSEEEEYEFSSISQTLISSLGGDKIITLNNSNKIIAFYIAK